MVNSSSPSVAGEPVLLSKPRQFFLLSFSKKTKKEMRKHSRAGYFERSEKYAVDLIPPLLLPQLRWGKKGLASIPFRATVNTLLPVLELYSKVYLA